ncbi:MAG: hypothetical protein JRH09_16890, partial [Deltaproteobacteria bacterium]|nr:hypothetical protein [Deltaproteobacteria bacterium]
IKGGYIYSREEASALPNFRIYKIAHPKAIGMYAMPAATIPIHIPGNPQSRKLDDALFWITKECLDSFGLFPGL